MNIVIYGKTACPSCDQAKQYLEKKDINFEYKCLGTDYTISDFYEVAPRSHRTFPMISFNGEYLGSFEDLKKTLMS